MRIGGGETGGMPRLTAAVVHRAAGDVLAGAVVVALALLPYPDGSYRSPGVLALVASLPAVVLPLRRRRPLGVLVAVLAVHAGLALAGTLAPGVIVAAAIATYAAAGMRARPGSILVVVAAAASVLVLDAVALRGAEWEGRNAQFVMLVALAGALGDAARSRRAYVAAITDRAERAERSRETEARRRVAEERLRIARDLHDTVAHRISVISLNAGVASSTLASDPARAEDALGAIRSASRGVLGEIGELLTMLRTDTSPVPAGEGLEEVEALASGFAEAGLAVTLRMDAAADAVPPATGAVAYLVLQEALTNALKHGDGAASVTIVVAAGELRIEVVNALGTAARAGRGAGHGLAGVRERVDAVAGRLHVSAMTGRFRLIARLPLPGARTAEER